MTNVTRINANPMTSPEQTRAFVLLDETVVNALNAAKAAGVPQGLIVAILHGHALQETAQMMGD